MAMSPRLLRPRATGFTPADADARAYVAAVRTADGQPLENNVARAIDTFVLGCKTDGTWDAITHCALLAGPRTIAGCCVALKGTAPTSNAFVAGDYNRKTGLIGSTANTKFLNTNVNNNTFAQDNFHMSIEVHTAQTSGSTLYMMGAGASGTGASEIFSSGNSLQFRNQNGTNQSPGAATDTTTGLIGSTRSSSSTYTMRYGANSGGAGTRTSAAPFNGTIHVFRTSSFSTLFSNARLRWYSMGANINFALLRTRLITLYADIAAGIP
jgi:hypothetical protein